MYYAVIMAGGSGTRLWPFSRRGRPKQMLALNDERPLFNHAVDRLLPLFRTEQILVVTRMEHASALRELAPELPPENFVIEPEGRGTAPAIGLAATVLQQRDPTAVMAVVTSDHYIVRPSDDCAVLVGQAAHRAECRAPHGHAPRVRAHGRRPRERAHARLALLAHLYPETAPARPIARNEARAAWNRQLCSRYTVGETNPTWRGISILARRGCIRLRTRNAGKVPSIPRSPHSASGNSALTSK